MEYINYKTEHQLNKKYCQSESMSWSLSLSLSASLSVSFTELLGGARLWRNCCISLSLVCGHSLFSSASSSATSWALSFSFPLVLGRLEQCRHEHPSEQVCPFFRHLHLHVVQPVLHLHPFVSRSTLSLTAAWFSSLSQSMEGCHRSHSSHS